MSYAWLITQKHGGRMCMCDVLEQMAYDDYIQQNGRHFSEKLARHAVAEMTNRTGDGHSWTETEVAQAMRSLGISVPEDQRWDAWYLANMAYADFYGSSLKTETDCIRWAADFISDPDGTPGRAFTHYAAEKMGSENPEKFSLEPFI